MDDKHKKYNDHPVYQRIRASGPKRILSLDGGGIRGAITLGYLEKIETLLQERYMRPDLVLSDYFDLVGGTSTGSIIATLIAMGEKVRDIKALYFRLGERIFTKRKHPLNWWLFKYLLFAEYDHGPLEEELKEKLNKLTLGSKDLLTGLAIFAKRADTFSIWNFHNNPLNVYYEENKGLLLRDLLRASCAPPSYFKPHKINLSDGGDALFMDGGVSVVNNPSLALFQMATVSGYNYNWKMGADNLQIISIGTGYGNTIIQGDAIDKLLRRRSIFWVSHLTDMFMVDATEQNQFLLQYFSNAHRPQILNSEVKDLRNDLITEHALLDYCRYNIRLDSNTLNAIGIYKNEKELDKLRKIDNGENAKDLFLIGERAANEQVSSDHFRDVFDFRLDPTKDIIFDQEECFSVFYLIICQQGQRYKKYKSIVAKKATEKMEIISITSDGMETKNTAFPGDYIVENQTYSKEQYIIQADRFLTLYDHDKELQDGWAEYSPKGEVQAIALTPALRHELKLPVHFHIIASWGQDQYVSSGDYLAIPLGHREIYRIGKVEMDKTYKLVSS